MPKARLEDLTKAELIALIRESRLCPPPRTIALIVYARLSQRTTDALHAVPPLSEGLDEHFKAYDAYERASAQEKRYYEQYVKPEVPHADS